MHAPSHFLFVANLDHMCIALVGLLDFCALDIDRQVPMLAGYLIVSYLPLFVGKLIILFGDRPRSILQTSLCR